MKKFLCIVLCAIMFLLGACASSVVGAEQTYPLKIWMQNSNGAYHTLLVVDEDTGVNYVVVAGRYSDGYAPESIGITPRLNADGTLYTGG